MFIKDMWYVAGWSRELVAGKISSLTIIGEPLAMYRRPDGTPVAVENRCPHRFAPLSKGRLEDDGIRCMYHGLKFGSDGRCLSVPGQSLIPPGAALRVFPIVERYGWIWIWMGDPEGADAGLIPDCVGIDHPDWALKPDALDYNANYQLICDNLLDFTHLAFVHANSFGATEEWALARPKVTRRDSGVHVDRWVVDQPPPPHQQELGQIDYFNTYDFILPGILLMYEYIYPAGTAAKFENRPPDFNRDVISASFSMQVVTPMTEQTTRYFFAWGPRAVEDLDGLGQAFYEVALQAFGEDKEMIEAQQQIINADPSRSMANIIADRGLLLFRHMVSERIANDELRSNADAL